MVFLAGGMVSLYPFIHGFHVDRSFEQTAEEFLSRVEITPATDPTAEPMEPTEPEETEPKAYPELWDAMTAYNAAIYAEGQSGLSGPSAYETPSFDLTDYGLEDEIFGVISIPALELEMPLYLGATYQHMADGAAHLSQTSIPIGGNNTNAVIAGHRGWRGASYFRYITELQVGDEVIITNLWETLTYRVAETQIIWPYEVDQILIQENRDLITLLTCHPYASGGKQRYLVICERAE